MSAMRFGLYPRIVYDRFVPPGFGGLSTASSMAMRELPGEYQRVYDWRDWRDAAALAVGLNDIRALGYANTLQPTRERERVAVLGVQIAAWMSGMDWLLRAPGEHDERDLRHFSKNCAAALNGKPQDIFPVIALKGEAPAVVSVSGMQRRAGWPGRRRGVGTGFRSKTDVQEASYGVGVHVGGQLRVNDTDGYAPRTANIEIFGEVMSQTVARHSAGAGVEELLSMALRAGAGAIGLLALAGEAVDGRVYVAARESARAFGAATRVLEQWSALVGDLRSGARSFATEFVRQHGASRVVLRGLATMALDTADAQFKAGNALLGGRRQREIYRTLQWRAERQFGLGRSAITPKRVAAALNASA